MAGFLIHGSEMANLFTAEKFQAVGPNGPIMGAQIFSYAATTLNQKATYTDQGGLSENTNPVITGADGRASIWLGAGGYRFRVFDSVANGGALIDDVDNVSRFVTENDLTAISGSLTAFETRLADSTLVTNGPSLVGYGGALNYAANTIGWGLRTSQNLTNALRYIPVSEWAGILNGTTTTDLTIYIQAGLDAEGALFFPRGKWPVSATTGLVVKNGTKIRGAGQSQTIFWAILGTGGSSSQIAGYTAGSVFRRQFNVSPGTNQYVIDFDIDECSVILNHPTASITTTSIQVGIDLRNITRSKVGSGHGFYCGNYVPPGWFVTKSDPPAGFAQQGFGIMIGNVAAGLSSYAGGEGNYISARVWGAYKLIVQDDATYSPGSAAHDTRVEYCDLQGGHHALVQESQYSTGVIWFHNTNQFCIKQNADASSTYNYKFTGYNSFIGGGGYSELGANTDYVLKLEPSSKGNEVSLGFFDGSAGCLIVDSGTNNSLKYGSSTATLPAVTSDGPLIELHDKAYRSGRAKATVSAGVITMVESVGEATISRVGGGAGRFKLSLAKPMPSANWACDVFIENVSGNFGGAMPISGSQSTTDYQFFTYVQVAGSTANNDPVMISAHFYQR